MRVHICSGCYTTKEIWVFVDIESLLGSSDGVLPVSPSLTFHGN